MATKFGLTLSNRGIVTGSSTLEDMLTLARQADANEAWESIWVGIRSWPSRGSMR